MHVYIRLASFTISPPSLMFSSCQPVKFVINEFLKQQVQMNTRSKTVPSCQILAKNFVQTRLSGGEVTRKAFCRGGFILMERFLSQKS